MARLTKSVRQQILNQNDGFRRKTYYEARNSRIETIYTIKNGYLYIRSVGDTSWSDSDFDDERVASDEEVHRFLYKFQDEMDLSGIE